MPLLNSHMFPTAARNKGTVIGGMWFPQGYPTKLESNRKISTCSSCSVPLRMPDPAQPGQLKGTPEELHQPHCPRFTGGRVFKSGAKAGQKPASRSKHKG